MSVTNESRATCSIKCALVPDRIFQCDLS